MDALYFYGFWSLLVILILVIALLFVWRCKAFAWKTRSKFLEYENKDLLQARKESSDIFTFAVRYLIIISECGADKFKSKILKTDISEDNSLERKAIDKIVFILEKDEPTKE